MHQRKFIVGSLILFFFILTGGLTSCALFENASGSDLTNAVGMSEENGPGSGQWIPPQPKNRNQCLQLHSVGVTLKEDLDRLSSEMEPIRARCVDENGEFLPGVEKAECIANFSKFYDPSQLIIADLLVGGARYTESCTSAEGGSTLPEWPLAEGEKDDPPKPTVEPDPDPKDPPETEDPEDDDDWGCCWCLTCTQRLDTGYVFRPLIISPKG